MDHGDRKFGVDFVYVWCFEYHQWFGMKSLCWTCTLVKTLLYTLRSAIPMRELTNEQYLHLYQLFMMKVLLRSRSTSCSDLDRLPHHGEHRASDHYLHYVFPRTEYMFNSFLIHHINYFSVKHQWWVCFQVIRGRNTWSWGGTADEMFRIEWKTF